MKDMAMLHALLLPDREGDDYKDDDDDDGGGGTTGGGEGGDGDRNTTTMTGTYDAEARRRTETEGLFW